MVRLSERLQAVADLITPGLRVSDVGCDHGQLSCALLRRGTPWVAASDISAPSLEKARRLGEELGFSDRLRLTVSDGLDAVPDGIGAVVIAGLSAHTIEAILRADPEKAHAVPCLILQPMQDMEGLRRYLAGSGFVIEAEDLVFENRRWYPILRAVPGRAEYTAEELDFGPKLLAQPHPLLSSYLDWRIGVVRRAARDLSPERRADMDSEIARMKSIQENAAGGTAAGKESCGGTLGYPG